MDQEDPDRPAQPAAAGFDAAGYWRANLKVMGVLLSIWFAVSFGAGILFARPLNAVELPGTGFPLGLLVRSTGIHLHLRGADLRVRGGDEPPRPTVRRVGGLRPAPMDVQTWTFAIVGLTFALYIGIALRTRAGSTKDFYVAGGGVPPLANGMATAADWMSAASFISMAGLISFMGYDGSVYLMGWTGGYVLLALLLAPYLRKFGKFTVPDFVGTATTRAPRPRRRGRLRHLRLLHLRGGPDAWRRGRVRTLPRGRGADRGRDRHGDRPGVRGPRRHEGDHLHPGRAVLRVDLRLHGAGDLHRDPDDRDGDSSARFRRRSAGRAR